MSGVHVDTEATVLDPGHAHTLPSIPVAMVDLMRIAVECEHVMEHVLDQVLGEEAAAAADEPALKVVRVREFCSDFVPDVSIVVHGPDLLQGDDVKVGSGLVQGLYKMPDALTDVLTDIANAPASSIKAKWLN